MALAVPRSYANDVAAACPSHQTVMLYEEAIAALTEAVAAIARDDIETRCIAVRVATEVITTLYLNLDIGRSGEIVDDLGNLYGHILGRLLRINLYNDPEIAEQVIELLEPLRDSEWNPDGVIAAAEPRQKTSSPNGACNAAKTNAARAAPEDTISPK